MFTYEIITDLSRTRPIFLDSAENNKYNVTITILRGDNKNGQRYGLCGKYLPR